MRSPGGAGRVVLAGACVAGLALRARGWPATEAALRAAAQTLNGAVKAVGARLEVVRETLSKRVDEVGDHAQLGPLARRKLEDHLHGARHQAKDRGELLVQVLALIGAAQRERGGGSGVGSRVGSGIPRMVANSRGNNSRAGSQVGTPAGSVKSGSHRGNLAGSTGLAGGEAPAGSGWQWVV